MQLQTLVSIPSPADCDAQNAKQFGHKNPIQQSVQSPQHDVRPCLNSPTDG